MNVYASTHAHSQAVCKAFSLGGNYPVRVAPCGLAPGAMFTYGNLRGLGPILAEAQAKRQDWYYSDRGYFLASRGNDYSGYFRVTKNAYMHDGTGNAGPKRWARLGKKLQPWQKDGSHILVCPPGAVLGKLRGFSAAAWLESTLNVLRKNTDRKIIVRPKDTKTPFAADLAGAFALVTHSSNSAVDALITGVPVFVTERSAAFIMGWPQLEYIETPTYPDREQWAWNLAANQWTLSEFRDGTTRKELGL